MSTLAPTPHVRDTRDTRDARDPLAEQSERFACFGTTVEIRAAGADADQVRLRIGMARLVARDVHRRLTRFDPGSELSQLNADPREHVPASGLLQRFAQAVRRAGELSEGLVDATVLGAVEDAGYREHWTPGDASRFAVVPGRGKATAVPGSWPGVRGGGGFVQRPPGVRLDSGGLGKGLAADLMARVLGALPAWLISCGGDVVFGGTAGRIRPIDVTDPLDPGHVLHRLRLAAGAVATSGVTARRWPGGHHLIDPRTGAPSRSDVLQATAVAGTGVDAEIRAKAALLAGSARAAQHLPDGGVLVTGLGELIVLHAGPRDD